jgi:hypothetical protein
MTGKYMADLADRGGCEIGGPPKFRLAHKRKQHNDSPEKKETPSKSPDVTLTSGSRNSPGEPGIGLSGSFGAKDGRNKAWGVGGKRVRQQMI